ncbi:hypothetical protein BDZ91DRAFT_731001 [Kalaharituber pfeilii]|nr:hypothetical protein BDZ91DRAFT_731001 [Kalaharituber pfeilii]
MILYCFSFLFVIWSLWKCLEFEFCSMGLTIGVGTGCCVCCVVVYSACAVCCVLCSSV